MLFFDRRIRLCEMFENWAEQNKVATTNESFIAWLVINHLVDEEKTNRFISNGGWTIDAVHRHIHRQQG